MNPIKISLIQTPWTGSRETMQAAYRVHIRQATQSGAQLICLQEFSLSPYFASVRESTGWDWAEPLEGGVTHQFLGGLAKEHGVYIIGSIFERENAHYWDTATLYNPGGDLHGFTRKVHIPSGEGYHEDHYFGGAAEYPLHEVLGVKIGIPTCYDQWFPELSRIYALRGADFLFYPTAIGSEPTAPGVDTRDAWQTVMRGQAIASGLFIAAANRVGVEGVTFYGSSFICAPDGLILAQGSRNRAQTISADLNPAALEEWRRLFPLLHQRRPDAYAQIID